MHKYNSFLKEIRLLFSVEYKTMTVGEVFYDSDELVHTITCTFRGRTLELYPRRLHLLFEITHLPRAHFLVSLRDGCLWSDARIWPLTEKTFKCDRRSMKDDKVRQRVSNDLWLNHTLDAAERGAP